MENQHQKIPTSEYKSVIKKDWYPNTPDKIIKDDIITIQKRLKTNVNSQHIRSSEIVELFKLHGKPAIFQQENYESYIKSYEKKQPFNVWLSERR